MSLADQFSAWVLAPERTIEEAFAAKLLIDQGIVAWKSKHKVDDPNRCNVELRQEGCRNAAQSGASRGLDWRICGYGMTSSRISRRCGSLRG